MVLKIYDRQHQLSDYAYSDRFNHSLQLNPGWNDISISLDEVQSAPRNRELDMAEIVSFSLFLPQLDKPLIMFFDGLHLSSKTINEGFVPTPVKPPGLVSGWYLP